MNGMLILSRRKAESRLLQESFSALVFRDLSEDWVFHRPDSLSELDQIAEGLPPAISCVDVTGREGISPAEDVRRRFDQTLLVVIADPELSPITYIRPSVMPAGVLLRPVERTQVLQVFPALLQMIKEAAARTALQDQVFSLTSHGVSHRIRMRDILYFEARNKKLYLVTKNCEIDFYDTLEHVIEQLPADFIRCHKSFVVNRHKVDRVLLAQNLILLEGGGIELPVSRTMKQAVKEALA